jgi:hypothetical protein
LDNIIPFHHPQCHSPHLQTDITIPNFQSKDLPQSKLCKLPNFAYLPSLPVLISYVNGKIRKFLFFLPFATIAILLILQLKVNR